MTLNVAPVEAIRAAFPALRRSHAGHPVAYFDGPGGTQVPVMVATAMEDYLFHHNANTEWAYPTSEETDALLLDARRVFASFLGGEAEEVVFGNNMTTLAFHVARSLGREWQAGDEVIITELDHHANVAPWQALARERGIVLRSLPLDTQTFQLRMDLLPKLIGSRTKLLAIGCASNALGTITDVAMAARLAHAAGALVFVDGVHFAPHMLPDVGALECDLFACSAYKFHGPHMGVLWGRHELLERLDVPRLEPAHAHGPERLETGTQNHEGILGGAAAVRWLASLSGNGGGLRERLASSYAEIGRREAQHFARLWDGLGEVPGVERYGVEPGGNRTPTLAFTMSGFTSRQVAASLVADGCFVSHGDFYAATVARRFGLHEVGMVRLGVACYTTDEEIDRVVAGVARLAD